MGQAELQAQKNNESQEATINFCKECQELYTIDDEAFGEAKIVQSQRSLHILAVKQRLFTNKPALQNYLKLCQERQKIQYKYIIRLLNCFSNNTEEYCSSFSKVYTVYEYLPSNLKKEIILKRQRRVYFSQGEVLHMLESVLSALTYLDTKNIYHQNIAPATILTESSRYKINDVQFITGMTGYERYLMGAQEDFYLSPELLKALQHRDRRPGHDRQKSDVFSLGLCALEMATLKSIKNCYDFDNFTVMKDVLEKQAQAIKTLYSEQLYDIIMLMLTMDEESRPGFLNVLTIVTNVIQNGRVGGVSGVVGLGSTESITANFNSNNNRNNNDNNNNQNQNQVTLQFDTDIENNNNNNNNQELQQQLSKSKRTITNNNLQKGFNINQNQLDDENQENREQDIVNKLLLRNQEINNKNKDNNVLQFNSGQNKTLLEDTLNNINQPKLNILDFDNLSQQEQEQQFCEPKLSYKYQTTKLQYNDIDENNIDNLSNNNNNNFNKTNNKIFQPHQEAFPQTTAASTNPLLTTNTQKKKNDLEDINLSSIRSFDAAMTNSPSPRTKMNNNNNLINNNYNNNRQNNPQQRQNYYQNYNNKVYLHHANSSQTMNEVRNYLNDPNNAYFYPHQNNAYEACRVTPVKYNQLKKKYDYQQQRSNNNDQNYNYDISDISLNIKRSSLEGGGGQMIDQLNKTMVLLEKKLNDFEQKSRNLNQDYSHPLIRQTPSTQSAYRQEPQIRQQQQYQKNDYLKPNVSEFQISNIKKIGTGGAGINENSQFRNKRMHSQTYNGSYNSNQGTLNDNRNFFQQQQYNVPQGYQKQQKQIFTTQFQ